METKTYTNVMAKVKKHPKFEEWSEVHRMRIHLAETLYRERTANHLTMAELAEKAQTTPAVISRIENAQVSPGIDLLGKIFRALGKHQLVLEF